MPNNLSQAVSLHTSSFRQAHIQTKDTTQQPLQEDLKKTLRQIKQGASLPSLVSNTQASKHMLSAPPHSLSSILEKPISLGSQSLPILPSETISTHYYKKRWGDMKNVIKAKQEGQIQKSNLAIHENQITPKEGSVNFFKKTNIRPILKSIAKRCANDVNSTSIALKRILTLPLALLEGLKLKKISSELSLKDKATYEAFEDLQKGFEALEKAEKELQNAPANAKILKEKNKKNTQAQLEKAQKHFTQAVLNSDLDYVSLKEQLSHANTLSLAEKRSIEEKIEQKEKKAYADYALKFKQKVALSKTLKEAIVWYGIYGLNAFSSLMNVLGKTGIPILSSIASLLGYLGDAMYYAFAGKDQPSNVKDLFKRYNIRKVAGKNIENANLDTELKIISKQIKYKQDFKTKVFNLLRTAIDFGSFGILTTGLVLGGLALLGVVSFSAAAVLLQSAFILGIITLSTAGGYLIYRLSRWVGQQANLANLEVQLSKANSPKDEDRISKKLLRQDGAFASYRLLERLQSNDSMVSEQTKNFLNQFSIFNPAEWEILNNASEENWENAAQLIGARLNIL